MPSITFRLLRADDHVVLDGQLFNLVVEDVDGVPHARATHDSCAIALTIAPQHFVEYADKGSQPAPTQLRPIYARPSTVTFRVPNGRTVPLTVSGVLDAVADLELFPFINADVLEPVEDPLDAVANGSITGERMRRASAMTAAARQPGRTRASSTTARPAATGPGAEPLTPLPGSQLTAPALLVWALPTGAARLTHPSDPVEREGRVEQWHTRLGTRTASGKSLPQERPVQIRAVGSLKSLPGSVDFNGLVDPVKINSPLNATTASQIASQSLLEDGEVDLDYLRLSPLGATLDLDGSWPSTEPVASYRHRIVAGRDERVRVNVRGTLFPFGHRATLTSTARRQLRGEVDGGVAALVRTSILTVKDRIKPFSDDGPVGRQWPWREVEILNRVSPPGVEVDKDGIKHLVVANGPFASICRVTDRAGHVATFSLPLLFVPDTISNGNARAAAVWNSRSSDLNQAQLGGQSVGLAPTAEGGGARAGASPDASTLVVQRATIAVATNPDGDEIVPVVQEFLGSSPVVEGLGIQPPTTILYAPQFLTHGFGAGNAGELVALLDGPQATIGQGAQTVMSAAMQVRAISRSVGAVASNAVPDQVAADLAAVAQGTFDPRSWFSGLDTTTLFGVFPLGLLLPGADTLELVKDAPQQTAGLLDGRKTFTSTWRTDLLRPGQIVSIGPALLRSSGEAMRLTLENTTTVVSPTEVRSRTVAQVENSVVALTVGGEELINLAVPSLRFETVDAAAPTVDVKVGKVGFLGALSFIATLASLLDDVGLGQPAERTAARALGTGGNGTGVQVHDDRVEASLVLAIPDLAVGVFSLTDLVLRSDFALYVDGGPPTLTLGFSSIEHPFRLTVSLLGGGGHILVKLSTERLEEVKGSLEFGAAIAVNLAGIVKGSASVMGGIRFELRPGDVDLAGYVHTRGHLDVLGLIALTMEVLVLVAYDPDFDTVRGSAEVSLKFKVLWFKKTVRFSVEHEFAGGGSSSAARAIGAARAAPTTAAAWDDYCDAFLAA